MHFTPRSLSQALTPRSLTLYTIPVSWSSSFSAQNELQEIETELTKTDSVNQRESRSGCGRPLYLQGLCSVNTPAKEVKLLMSSEALIRRESMFSVFLPVVEKDVINLERLPLINT